MWQFLLGFGAGVYVGTKYDCDPAIKFMGSFLKEKIPKEMQVKEKDK
jgi:hypothetical protein